MLLSDELSELRNLEKISSGVYEKEHLSIDDNRAYFRALRDALHLYEDIVKRCIKQRVTLEGDDYRRLRNLAGIAIDKLGGQGEPCPISLKYYDYRRYGPFLGISDEGSAAQKIRDAAWASPKMLVLGFAEPIVLGMSHDAERLGAVGEVAVGIEEYREIRLECIGRLLTSTNVGTRLNVRYYKKHPVISLPSRSLKRIIETGKKQATAIIEPFWKTPNKIPRPLTVLIKFDSRTSLDGRSKALKTLKAVLAEGKICDPTCHNLGLLVEAKRGRTGLKQVMNVIDLATNVGLKEVVVKGAVLGSADAVVSLPGFLNYFSPENVEEILRYAEQKGVSISPFNVVDVDTVARNVWSMLCTARNMGLELGKYGLFPLTLEESSQVMERVQAWFSSWTAAPAFYIDYPTYDTSAVYTEENVELAIRKWLQIVGKHNIPVVLIDTADKDKKRRLLKDDIHDKAGILQIEQIGRINDYANHLGIKVLWAGGITISQVSKMGSLGVFGVYVTTAATESKPVSKEYERDPMLATEKEPISQGVFAVKLLLETGFLIKSSREQGLENDCKKLEDKAKLYLNALNNHKSIEIERNQNELILLVVEAWKSHFKYTEKLANFGLI